MKTVNVMLVDDSEQFLDAFSKFLQSDSFFRVIGLLRSGEEAIEKANVLNPDLVLMDYSMPGIGGIEAIKAIKSNLKTITSIIITNHKEIEYRHQANQIGTDGFILKSDINKDTLELIKSIIKYKNKTKLPKENEK